MNKYILKRILLMIVTLFVIASITFFLMKIIPGTPYSNPEKLTEKQRIVLDAKYGFDKPVAVQYLKYIGGLVQGDLGYSFQFEGRTVISMIQDRIGPSAMIGIQAMIIGTIIGLLLGIISALRHNTIIDYLAVTIAVLGMSIPSFVLAALLQYVIGVKLQWLPVALWESYASTILPSIALSVVVVATVARFIRSEMLEVLGQEYVVTARAKGLKESTITMRHVIRNALIPVVTMLGPLAVSIITGTLVIEKIFGVPGLGEQFTLSILVLDYSVIMGITLFYSALFIFIVFIVDILYMFLDPRIDFSKGGQ